MKKLLLASIFVSFTCAHIKSLALGNPVHSCSQCDGGDHGQPERREPRDTN